MWSGLSCWKRTNLQNTLQYRLSQFSLYIRHPLVRPILQGLGYHLQEWVAEVLWI